MRVPQRAALKTLVAFLKLLSSFSDDYEPAGQAHHDYPVRYNINILIYHFLIQGVAAPPCPSNNFLTFKLCMLRLTAPTKLGSVEKF